jgi:mannan endo-1,4-beta-mannosidase
MRVLLLHAMTVGATLAILVVLAVPAKHVLDAGRADEALAPPAVAAARFAPAAAPRRVFGVYVDPWHVDEWAAAIGAAPQAVAKFTAFSSRRPVGSFLDEASRKGLRRVLVSWEPWAPVPSRLGAAAQAQPQPGYRNVDIARGVQDRYITRFARDLAGFRGTVYLRYAHEMNGYWYPWSRNPRAYRWAWRRIVRLFALAGARNVRFVWSVNANLYERPAAWRATLRRYWPGRRNVDLVATTMIDFGGTKSYPVRRFAPRLRALRALYGKPVVLAETNTQLAGAAAWISDLRHLLRRLPWVRAVFWSQLPSRGKVQQAGSGMLDWDVQRQPASAWQLRGVIRDGLR